MTASVSPKNPSDAPALVVLVVNLGTPDAPTPAAVRRYLAEFLCDRRVIDLPRWLWLPLLYGVILRIRPRRSARAYASIWTDAGSPLRVYSQSLANQLDRRLRAATAGSAGAVLAMRYGRPAIAATVQRLHAQGMRRLLVLPLYPQYSATSSGSVLDAVMDTFMHMRWPPDLRFVSDYHADEKYISILAASVRRHWAAHGRADRLLLSFHGIPERYARAGDPYADQCHATALRLSQELALDETTLQIAFQSRVGREAWLQPYTEDVLRRWPGEGVRRIQVLCPGFAVDCLETLEEIAMRDRDLFVSSGGDELQYIPALNDGPTHVDMLYHLIRRECAGWLQFDDAGLAEAPA